MSTIGAGDTFNAGLIYSFIRMGIQKSNVGGVTAEMWKKVIETSVSFAANVCMSYDNYISADFAEKIKKN